MRLHRTQLFLRPDQHATLAKLAERQEVTVSEVLRQVVDEWMEDRQARKARGLEALERLREVREQIERRVGVLPAELALEARRDLERRGIPPTEAP
ncbi:MAG TPA: hypothetical protein VHM02_06895 [Thermoanaerobaculia bacterium]|nr:hypothetical protein [Thermoanaerobaculia bacterium]